MLVSAGIVRHIAAAAPVCELADVAQVTDTLAGLQDLQDLQTCVSLPRAPFDRYTSSSRTTLSCGLAIPAWLAVG